MSNSGSAQKARAGWICAPDDFELASFNGVMGILEVRDKGFFIVEGPAEFENKMWTRLNQEIQVLSAAQIHRCFFFLDSQISKMWQTRWQDALNAIDSKWIIYEPKTTELSIIVSTSDAKVLCRKETRVIEQREVAPVAQQLVAPPIAATQSLGGGTTANRLKVLIVDDSTTMQKFLVKSLSFDPQIEVVGVTGSPLQVVDLIHKLKPHAMTLDINMDEMDGDELLTKIFPKNYLPTLVVSALGLSEGTKVMRALAAGATDYLQKPNSMDVLRFGKDLSEKLWAIKDVVWTESQTTTRSPNFSIPEGMIWAVGASTGGTEALRIVLESFPTHIPPTVIGLHIPPYFSDAFARRMNDLSPFTVREGKDGDQLEPDLVLVAPGGCQTRVESLRGRFYLNVETDTSPTGHKPNIDVLFESIAAFNGVPVVAGILTGMGRDGAKGLLAIKQRGGFTMAQDEASSVVYGMPKAAAQIGASCEILPLNQLGLGFCRGALRFAHKRGA